MNKSTCLAAALLVGVISFPVCNNAYGNHVNMPTPCQAGGGTLSVAKRTLTTADFRYVGQPVLQSSKSRLGSTPDEVQANFADIIEANFQYGSTEHLLNGLSERELNDLADLYAIRTQGNTQPLLKIFAKRLSDQSLIRVAKVFGTKQVSAAVNEYASPDIQSSFNTKVAAIDPVQPLSGLATPMAAPTLDMTLQEIYLEFRTAPVGSVGPTAAIAETTMYSAIWLTAAWKTGTAIGNQLHDLIVTYDPSLDDAIGGTVAGMVDQANQSWDQFTQGEYQNSFDALFGYPVTNSENPAGDFGEFSDMDFYLNACSP
ncbi:hypothetical protein [Dyella psychrodurans]|uniref:hypothetical protein n=1 Tax=Dyella psychrodurans TaxID=1927960 RepID=UPI0011C02564|nr:hypothetical protein [Dyella psychrodurans]